MDCPICADENTKPVRVPNGYGLQATFGVTILECSMCKFLFADFIHPMVIDYYYNNICRTSMSSDAFKKLRHQAKICGQSQLKTLQPFLPEKLGRVLDFGGGSGEMARLLLPVSEEVYITESDQNCIAHIKEEPRLLLIDGDRLLDEKFISSFDLIIFSNVLEHMTHPIRRIQDFSRILKTDGQLFVEIPNEAPLLRNNGRHCQQHICFFTPDTFRKLVEVQGSFDIEDIRTCGPKLEELYAADELLHDFDALDTPNGWVIRALLKNTRPNIETIDINLPIGDIDNTLRNLSNSASRWALERN